MKTEIYCGCKLQLFCETLRFIGRMVQLNDTHPTRLHVAVIIKLGTVPAACTPT